MMIIEESKKQLIKKILKISALIGAGLVVLVLIAEILPESSEPSYSGRGYETQGVGVGMPNPLGAESVSDIILPGIMSGIMGEKASHNASAPNRAAGQSQTDRKVIKTSDIDLVVKNVNDFMQMAAQTAAANGGFVENANVSKTSEGKLRGDIQIKVPVDKFENALDVVEKSDLVEEVISKRINSSDVTKEFIDYSARLKVLMKTEEELLNLLKKSGNLGDILNIHRELNETRTKIEQLQSQLNYLVSQIDYATISISVSEEVPEFLGIRWKPAVKIKQEIQNLLKGLKNYGDFGIAFFFHYLPLLIIWLASFWLIFWVLNKIYKRLKERFNWQFQATNVNFIFWLKILGLFALGLIIVRILF